MKLIAVLAIAVGVAYAQECGNTPIKPDESRIVGGKDAIPYSWPWQVQLQRRVGSGFSLLCGGSILDATHILTASHCQFSPSSLRVVAAVYNTDASDDGIVTRNVESFVQHPNYDDTPFNNDVAVITLTEPLEFGDKVQPVCIPAQENGVTGQDRNAIVTGFGTTRSGGSLPRNLMQVRVPYTLQSDCEDAYPGTITENMVCAGNLNDGGVDSCQGDSGGPMVTKASNGKYYEYGVVSFGRGCALPGFPGVYARPNTACDFLASATGNANICVGGND